MKMRFVVSLAAAFALMIFVPAGANAVGVGKTCGGFAGLPCDAGLFCEQKPGQCHMGFDMSGTCVRVPQLCPRFVRLVCGCDGKTFNNDCERQQAMVSKNHNGPCQ